MATWPQQAEAYTHGHEACKGFNFAAKCVATVAPPCSDLRLQGRRFRGGQLRRVGCPSVRLSIRPYRHSGLARWRSVFASSSSSNMPHRYSGIRSAIIIIAHGHIFYRWATGEFAIEPVDGGAHTLNNMNYDVDRKQTLFKIIAMLCRSSCRLVGACMTSGLFGGIIITILISIVRSACSRIQSCAAAAAAAAAGPPLRLRARARA